MKRTTSIICGWGLATLTGVLLGFSAGLAQANDVEESVTVSTSSPPPAVGFNEGGGDGLNWTGTGDNKRLKVTLNAPADKEIKCASQTVISEGIAWDCADWDTWAASHLYTSALITPKDFFRPLFSGPIRGGGGPGGGPPPTWYAGVIQADIQGDADNDSTTAQRPPATAEAERKEEEVAEQGGTGNTAGLIIPVNDNYHEGGTGAVTNIDYAHAGVITGDGDLVQARLILKLPTEVVPDSRVKLTYDSSKLLVYKVSGGSATLITSGIQAEVSTFGTDNTLLFEGIAASSSSGGNSIQVTLTPKSGDVSRDKLTATVVKIDVDIYSGTGRAGATLIAQTLAPETNHDTDALEDEEDLGAFTVANLNNTNGNLSGGADVVDLNETNVVASGSRGYDDVDLLQLRLQRPTPADLPGHVRIQIVSGNVKIWPDATKTGDEITGAALTKAMADFGANPHIAWYVEAREATALQGIKLKYEYRPKADGQWMAAPTDVVAATGIWVVHEAPAGTDALEDRSGIAGRNAVRVWFRVYPNNIASIPARYGDGTGGNPRCRPQFDVTRQVAGGIFGWANDVAPLYNLSPIVMRADPAHVLYNHFPESLPDVHSRNHNEYANDDDSRTEEPNANGYLYGDDSPRCAIGADFLRALRANFKEFVRVRFDGTDPGGTPEVNDGSRCSVYASWYAQDTDGAIQTPRGTGSGHIAFAREAIHTAALATAVVRTRHHGVCRGLTLSTGTGVGAQSQGIECKDDDTIAPDDVLQTLSATTAAGTLVGRMNENNTPPAKDDRTQIGDHLAYIAVAYFVSDKDGKIRGPDDTSDDTEASLYHEIVVEGGADPESPRTPVSGTAFPYTLLDAAVPATLTKGDVTAVQMSGQVGGNDQWLYVEADTTGGGNQDVTVCLIDDDGVGYNTLVRVDLSLARQLLDEKTGGLVDAVVGGGLLIPAQTVYVGVKCSGEIGGKDGWSDEGVPGNRCDFAVRIDSDGKKTSPSVDRFGPTYSPPAGQFSATSIPVDGTVTMSMAEVYVHATGATGNQDVMVRARHDKPLDTDPILNTQNISHARPANCFTGMLMGPVTVADVTLYNVNGKVAGDASGTPASGAQTAHMYYQIDESPESPRTDVSTKLAISGRITQGGGGLAGVTVSADGQSDDTDANGDYRITGLDPGTKTVTPSMQGKVFTPASRQVNLSDSHVTGQDFTAADE